MYKPYQTQITSIHFSYYIRYKIISNKYFFTQTLDKKLHIPFFTLVKKQSVKKLMQRDNTLQNRKFPKQIVHYKPYQEAEVHVVCLSFS